MEKIRDFIPKTYMPILFGALILCVPTFFLALSLIVGNRNIAFQIQEIKSLGNPDKYLFADTLIVDSRNVSHNGGGSQIFNIELIGRLKSNLNLKRRLYQGSLSAETSRDEESRLHFMFECTGCNHDTTLYCECLPVLRSNLHNEIYANNPDTLDEESTKIIMDIIMETYLFWIVPFLFLYYKITQLLYHYLDRKINEKRS